MKVFIIGVNGFIGSHLAQFIVDNKADWTISGVDLNSERVLHLLDNSAFHFKRADFTASLDYVDEEIRRSDVVVPLAAIATPKAYVTDPLKVFELDFEANMHVVRKCMEYRKRLIFPSTSEVYGMCQDDAFDEYESNLVMGPVCKSRWIYGSSKQLLDRVITAYGEKGLEYTIFRPFNWIGVGQDDVHKAGGSCRVVTQFIGNLLRGEPLQLVDGGRQKRTFLDISDGIRALVAILENSKAAKNQIFNIGNPSNEYSIAELAEIVVRKMIDRHHQNPKIASPQGDRFEVVAANDYYGTGYQDMDRRVPSIKHINQQLGWQPQIGLEETIENIVNWHATETPPNILKYDI